MRCRLRIWLEIGAATCRSSSSIAASGHPAAAHARSLGEGFFRPHQALGGHLWVRIRAARRQGKQEGRCSLSSRMSRCFSVHCVGCRLALAPGIVIVRDFPDGRSIGRPFATHHFGAEREVVWVRRRKPARKDRGINAGTSVNASHVPGMLWKPRSSLSDE